MSGPSTAAYPDSQNAITTLAAGSRSAECYLFV